MSADGSNTVYTEFFDCRCRSRRTNQKCSSLERIDARIVQRFGCWTNAFDVDSIDLMDFGDQQLDKRVVRKFDHELIDCATGATLQDVDASHVSTNCADPARQGTQRSGTIRHPHSKDVGLSHVHTLGIASERHVSMARHERELT
jgi:hypothetical protein